MSATCLVHRPDLIRQLVMTKCRPNRITMLFSTDASNHLTATNSMYSFAQFSTSSHNHRSIKKGRGRGKSVAINARGSKHKHRKNVFGSKIVDKKLAEETILENAAASSRLNDEVVKTPIKSPKVEKKKVHSKELTTLSGVPVGKIQLTLQEIASLQNTLPNPDEIAELVNKLRRQSFHKGHKLFDMYRNYGNPFLDENFLLPGVLACCIAKKPKEGIQVVRDMLNQGRKVEEKALRELLQVCDQTSSAEETIELWRLMERAGVKIDATDLRLFLDICYRKQYVDGAVQVLKDLRIKSNNVSIGVYMHWLLRATRIWKADAFFDLLMEMRLAGLEPEIPSLTSLERGRKDKALTVMEGVRAVGMDPHFAMASVFSSMQASIYESPQPLPSISAKAKKTAFDSIKGAGLVPIQLEWEVKPIPQLLETQAAGLILQQETFRRLKYHQVQQIDVLLEMLPITSNLTVNLRKQLQRMSLLVNTHRVRRDMNAINAQYTSGQSLIDLSVLHNYPPVSLMRIILRARGMNPIQVKRAINLPDKHLSDRDQNELRKAVRYDSIHKSDPFTTAPSYNAYSLETAIEHFLKAKGIRVLTEKELGNEQIQKYGRKVLSPDLLLLDPVVVNGTPIRWIDAKNYYGSHLVSKSLITRQLASYVNEWGPGAIVFGMGYSDMFSVPGVMCLDTTPFPTTKAARFKMRLKSFFYSCANVFRWKKHLGSDLKQINVSVANSSSHQYK